MVNRLMDNEIDVPEPVKEGKTTSSYEISDEKAALSFEFYGVQENDDGSLEIVKLGEYNNIDLKINKTRDGARIVISAAFDLTFGLFYFKVSQVELGPGFAVPEEEKKEEL